MANTKTIASGAAPKKAKKTVGQKIDKKIETIAKVDDIVIAEATKPVDTFTIQRWHVAVAAVIAATALFVIFI